MMMYNSVKWPWPTYCYFLLLLSLGDKRLTERTWIGSLVSARSATSNDAFNLLLSGTAGDDNDETRRKICKWPSTYGTRYQQQQCQSVHHTQRHDNNTTSSPILIFILHTRKSSPAPPGLFTVFIICKKFRVFLFKEKIMRAYNKKFPSRRRERRKKKNFHLVYIYDSLDLRAKTAFAKQAEETQTPAGIATQPPPPPQQQQQQDKKMRILANIFQHSGREVCWVCRRVRSQEKQTFATIMAQWAACPLFVVCGCWRKRVFASSDLFSEKTCSNCTSYLLLV